MAEGSFSTAFGIEIRGGSENIRVPAGIRRVEKRARPRSLVWRISKGGGGSVSDEESSSEDVGGVSSSAVERAVEGGMLVVVDVVPELRRG